MMYVGYGVVFIAVLMVIIGFIVVRAKKTDKITVDPEFNPVDELYKEQEKNRQMKDRLEEISKAANNLEYELREKEKELVELRNWKELAIQNGIKIYE